MRQAEVLGAQAAEIDTAHAQIHYLAKNMSSFNLRKLLLVGFIGSGGTALLIALLNISPARASDFAKAMNQGPVGPIFGGLVALLATAAYDSIARTKEELINESRQYSLQQYRPQPELPYSTHAPAPQQTGPAYYQLPAESHSHSYPNVPASQSQPGSSLPGHAPTGYPAQPQSPEPAPQSYHAPAPSYRDPNPQADSRGDEVAAGMADLPTPNYSHPEASNPWDGAQGNPYISAGSYRGGGLGSNNGRGDSLGQRN